MGAGRDLEERVTRVAGCLLRLRPVRMGEDLCLILSGGGEHIGAVAVAQPRPSLADPARTSATASVITLPGHKEDGLARELALKAAAALNVTVCVACGIHTDAPTPTTLDELLAASHALVDRLLAEMHSQASEQRDGTPAKGTP